MNLHADPFHDLVSGMDYPLFVVTVQAGADRAGCLVGFVTQASIAPPRMIVMVSKANHTFRVASAASLFAVHFLSAENFGLARLFGEQTGDEVDKFAGLDCSTGPGGTPIIRGTRGWVVGRVLWTSDCGDHVAHLLDVVEATIDRPGPQLGFAAARELNPGHPA